MTRRLISILIVDDEPLARQRLRMLLDKHRELITIGECCDGVQAVDTILTQKPDLVFLDVQMPELNGFEVLGLIGVERIPAVIFVTAYDQYAVRAFEVNAVDYLLKPFDRARFESAFMRALREIELRDMSGGKKSIDALLTTLQKDHRLPDRILAKAAGRISILHIEQIDWIESAGNYVKLHVGKETHLVRETMAQMERRLNSARFARIHRTAIVNMERIKELRPHFHGDYQVILDTGVKLALSRRYRNRLGSLIGGRE